jgi:hypothetical protein
VWERRDQIVPSPLSIYEVYDVVDMFASTLIAGKSRDERRKREDVSERERNRGRRRLGRLQKIRR